MHEFVAQDAEEITVPKGERVAVLMHGARFWVRHFGWLWLFVTFSPFRVVARVSEFMMRKSEADYLDFCRGFESHGF
jgi:hypothetical protein